MKHDISAINQQRTSSIISIHFNSDCLINKKIFIDLPFNWRCSTLLYPQNIFFFLHLSLHSNVLSFESFTDNEYRVWLLIDCIGALLYFYYLYRLGEKNLSVFCLWNVCSFQYFFINFSSLVAVKNHFF